jgi:hypothetical protein
VLIDASLQQWRSSLVYDLPRSKVTFFSGHTGCRRQPSLSGIDFSRRPAALVSRQLTTLGRVIVFSQSQVDKLECDKIP